MDDHRSELHQALVQAARLRAVELLRARGYTEFFVLSDEARIFRRLGWAARDAVPEGCVQHLYFGASEDGVFVRVGGALPPWWPQRASIHIDPSGAVRLPGPTRGDFLLALAECIRDAVTLVLSARPLPAAGRVAEIQSRPCPSGQFLSPQIISPCLPGAGCNPVASPLLQYLGEFVAA